ncbi:MAG: AlpA family phage regulatory protein, partial [Acinetobacter sp.]
KTIWQWVKRGLFPAPIKLSDSVTVWRLSDIQAWMQSKGLEA